MKKSLVVLVVVLLLLVFSASIYLQLVKIQKKDVLPIQATDNIPTKIEVKEVREQSPVETKCSVDECLTKTLGGEIYGTAKIEGYYTKTSEEEFGGKKASCSGFVITGGSQILRGYFTNLIDKGNTVNSKNKLGQPIININISDLSTLEKNALLNSSSSRTVDMIVLKRMEYGSDAPRCFSFIDILKVN